MADKLPLIPTLEAKKCAILDEKEGWVGDADEVEIAGGGKKPLRTLCIGKEERVRMGIPHQSAYQDRTVRLRRRS